jgi:hypothetical protein
VELFDLKNNWQFWFFLNFRSKEFLVPVFWKKSE